MATQLLKKSTQVFAPGYAYENKFQNGTSSNAFQSTSVLQSYREGYKNPKYKQQIARHESATTELLGVKHDFSLNPCHLVYSIPRPLNPLIQGELHGMPSGNWGPVPTKADLTLIDSSRAENIALSLFHQKINQAFTKLQGGVIAGEAKETIGMLKNRGRRLAKGVHEYLGDVMKRLPSAKRGRFRVKDLADLWLEYHFGWKPLINDVDDAIVAFNDRTGTYTSRVTAVSEQPVSSSNLSHKISADFAEIQFRRVIADKCIVIYTGLCEAADSTLGRKLQRYGFAPEHWIPTFYELIPFSFLADYFSNLNGIVYSISNFTVNVRWSQRTIVKQRMSVQFPTRAKVSSLSGTPGQIISSAMKPSSRRSRLVHRLPYDDLEIPGIEFQIPSAGQVANVIALILAGEEATRRYSRL